LHLYDRGRGFDANSHPAALVDVGTFSGNPPNDVLSGQNRCHNRLKLRRDASQEAISGPLNFPAMIPEIDIWRAAILMLKRRALDESTARAHQLGGRR
jgi:hypothetical protein